jgi:hypothetical protein
MTIKSKDLYDQTKDMAAANTGLAKVAVRCSADTFVVNQNLVLRINICGENRHLRQARNRCHSLWKFTGNQNISTVL